MRIDKSSRHSKITGDFAERLILYWLSKNGLECTYVDHVGIDLIAVNPRTRERKTTVKPFQKSTFLVATGVFAITRNPMYLGMVLLTLGAAVLLGSASPLAGVVIPFVLLDRGFVRPEKRLLAETFGANWSSY